MEMIVPPLIAAGIRAELFLLSSRILDNGLSAALTGFLRDFGFFLHGGWFTRQPISAAKSFYGKAKVIEIGNDVFLVSYTTVVAFYNRETKIAQVVGTFSPTTLRHIKEFLRQSGFKAETKKQIMKDYM